MQKYVTWILTALLFILKLKISKRYCRWRQKKKRCNTSKYEDDTSLPKGMNKKVIGLMKDELGRKITTELFTFRPPKTYFYLTDDDKNTKEVKETKRCVIKRILKFNDYKNCLRMKPC